jgi:Zn-dependent protease with chaperone function
MKYVVRAALAVGMLVGFYVLALSLVIGLVLGVLAVVEAFELDVGGLAGAKVLVLVVPVLAAVGYGVFFRTRDAPPRGLSVSEHDQPRLWALAREIAGMARTNEVDEIRLVPEPNAAVTDSATWLGLRRGTRRMFVGVPLLLAMDEPQLRSVVAHEFGHYSGRHTTLVRITYRGAESIRRILSQLGRRNVVARLLRLYGQLYFAISRSVNRRQEMEADRLGAQVAGAPAMASALLELRPADAAWMWYCQVFAGMGTPSGRRPAGFLAGFAAFLGDPGVVTTLEQVRDAPEPEQPSVYDTHPPISRRVAALGVDPSVVRQRQGWAVDVLDAPDQTLASLEQDLYDAALVPTPLDVLAPLAAAEAARRHARLVDDVLQDQGRTPGLRTVMQYLGNGQARELVRRELPRDVTDERLSSLTAEILGGYLGAALLAAGAASHRLDWQRGWVLVDPAGADLDLSELVAEVMATASRAAELDELLRLSGVDPSFRADDHKRPGPRTPDPETSRILGVLSPVNNRWTLVVHDDGLVLLTERAWQRLRSGHRPPRVSALMASSRARSIPWRQIEQMRLVQLAGGRARVLCDVTGGGSVDVKVGPRTVEAGEPFGAMRRLLGDRHRTEERVGTRM